MATKQCTRKSGHWQCQNRIPITEKSNRCEHHRSSSKAWYHDNLESNRKVARENYQRHRTSIISKKIEQEKTPKGKAASKKKRDTMLWKMSNAVAKMVNGSHDNARTATPHSVRGRGLFADNEDAMAHFESTFEPWMTRSNHGRHEKDAPYKAKWNIGHRFPKAIYDSRVDEDVNKCFHRDNLYAQCAKENVELQQRLNMSDRQLLALRHLWPAAARNSLSALKGLFKV